MKLGISFLFLTGCLSSAPFVPVTPQNQAQIATCQSIATEHDSVVVGDFVFGGVGAIAGTVGASLPKGNNTAIQIMDITAGVGAGVAAIGATVASFTASDFANSQCSNVVGPLPVGKQP